jgi:predicted RNA binding protein YcfA (HicA-like mRNA interferase family)
VRAFRVAGIPRGFASTTGEPNAPATRKSARPDVSLAVVSGEFPSLKARRLLRILSRLGYRVTRRHGSHRWLTAEGRPTLLFAHHDRVSVSPASVRKILVNQAGLTVDEALKVIHDG